MTPKISTGAFDRQVRGLPPKAFGVRRNCPFSPTLCAGKAKYGVTSPNGEGDTRHVKFQVISGGTSFSIRRGFVRCATNLVLIATTHRGSPSLAIGLVFECATPLKPTTVTYERRLHGEDAGGEVRSCWRGIKPPLDANHSVGAGVRSDGLGGLHGTRFRRRQVRLLLRYG